MIKKLFAAALFCALFAAFQTPVKAYYPPAQNEIFAVRAVRTLHSAEATYFSTFTNYGSLDNLRQAAFIDASLASGDKYGYHFVIHITPGTATTAADFYITATPQRYGKTGRKSFYINETGAIRGADRHGLPATADDPIFENTCLPNEECTIFNLRVFFSAEAAYQSISNNGYGTLNQLFAEGFISEMLARGYANGYNFALTTTAPTNDNPATFKISAVPITYGATGFRSFYIDENGVIHAADKHGEPATADDPVLEY